MNWSICTSRVKRSGWIYLAKCGLCPDGEHGIRGVLKELISEELGISSSRDAAMRDVQFLRHLSGQERQGLQKTLRPSSLLRIDVSSLKPFHTEILLYIHNHGSLCRYDEHEKLCTTALAYPVSLLLSNSKCKDSCFSGAMCRIHAVWRVHDEPETKIFCRPQELVHMYYPSSSLGAWTESMLWYCSGTGRRNVGKVVGQFSSIADIPMGLTCEWIQYLVPQIVDGQFCCSSPAPRISGYPPENWWTCSNREPRRKLEHYHLPATSRYGLFKIRIRATCSDLPVSEFISPAEAAKNGINSRSETTVCAPTRSAQREIVKGPPGKAFYGTQDWDRRDW